MLNVVCYVCVSSAAPYCMCIPLCLCLLCSIWVVITPHETLGYVDITCVMSVSKSPLPFLVSYDFFCLKIGNSILITCGLLHVYVYTNRECYSLLTCLSISILAHTSLLISVCVILASTTIPLH